MLPRRTRAATPRLTRDVSKAYRTREPGLIKKWTYTCLSIYMCPCIFLSICLYQSSFPGGRALRLPAWHEIYRKPTFKQNWIEYTNIDIHLSICLSIYLSICLSIKLPTRTGAATPRLKRDLSKAYATRAPGRIKKWASIFLFITPHLCVYLCIRDRPEIGTNPVSIYQARVNPNAATPRRTRALLNA